MCLCLYCCRISTVLMFNKINNIVEGMHTIPVDFLLLVFPSSVAGLVCEDS